MTEFERIYVVQGERFWLKRPDEPWVEITRDEYLAAERGAGFNAPDGILATAQFHGISGIRGTTLMPKEVRDASS